MGITIDNCCLFVVFLLVIVLSVLRFTASDIINTFLTIIWHMHVLLKMLLYLNGNTQWEDWNNVLSYNIVLNWPSLSISRWMYTFVVFAIFFILIKCWYLIQCARHVSRITPDRGLLLTRKLLNQCSKCYKSLLHLFLPSPIRNYNNISNNFYSVS
jgi:hypothetical protein